MPQQQFILDHAGLPDIRGGEHARWATALHPLAGCPNVAVKLSALDFRADWQRWKPSDLRPYLDTALELFGPSRLMIGSNWPVCTVSASYLRTLRALLDYLSKLTPSEQAEIRAGTVKRCYSIP